MPTTDRESRARRPDEMSSTPATFAAERSLKVVGRFALLTVVLAVALSAGSAASARGRSRPVGCPPAVRHSVVASDNEAEVYGLRTSEERVEFRGCLYGQSKSRLIGAANECLSAAGDCGGTDQLAIAGTVVACEQYVSSEVTGNRWLVEVKDLRSGRTLHRVPTGVTFPPNPMLVGDGSTTTIVVKKDGAVAWIVDTVQKHERFQVHALDRTGSRVLATGSDIDPHSLALTGSTLYWTQGHKPYSARLN